MSSPGYSDDDLYEALRKADAAGDTAGAQKLAQFLSARNAGASLAEQAAAPQQDPNPISRALKLYGGAAVQGVENLVGLPGTLQGLANTGVQKVENFLGADPRVTAAVKGSQIGFPTGSDITGVSNALGITNRPDAVPLTTGERIGVGATEGAAGAVPAALMTGGAALPALGIGATSGAAAEGAHEMWPKSTVAPIAAGMLTGFGIGGVANTIENTLTGRTLARTLTGAKGGLEMAQADAATIPAGAESIASQVAPEATLQQAGTKLQAAARAWTTGNGSAPSVMQTKMNAAWKPVSDLVGSDAPVPLAGLDKALNDITTSAGKLEPAASLLRPQAPNKIQQALGDIRDFIQTSGGGQPSWEEVKTLRSVIGDARGNEKIVGDIGYDNLNKMYAAVTKDMRNAAGAKGPDALKAFDAANSESSRLYGIARDQMSPILKASPEDAAKQLLQGGRAGGSDLQILRNEVPDATNSLFAAHLRTSPMDWRKMSPEAKAALAPDSPTAAGMDALLARGAQVPAARSALKAAKDAVAEHQTTPYNPMEGLLGSGIGYDLGVLGLNALGHPGHDIMGGAIGSLLGFGGSRLVSPLFAGYARNPQNLRIPLLGGAAGAATANQLTATGIAGNQ